MSPTPSRLPPVLALVFCAAVLAVFGALLWPQARQGGWTWLLWGVLAGGLLLLVLAQRTLAGEWRERERVGRELKRALALLDAGSDAILIYDPVELRIREANRAAAEQLGYPRAELLGMNLLAVKSSFSRKSLGAVLAPLLAGELDALSFEARHRRRDGQEIPVEVNARLVRLDEGGPCIASVARDITARKRAEEDRERLVRELRAALAEVRTLREILPICSYCKQIRDDENYWQSVESYISKHTNTRFSHGICPSCFEKIVEPQLDADDEG
jgi:PAS domain S-box-containing protein